MIFATSPILLGVLDVTGLLRAWESTPSSLAQMGDAARNALLVGGLILIVASVMMSLAKRRRSSRGARRTSGGDGEDHRLAGSERLERIRQEQGVRRDLDSLMVEIEEMTKRLSHQLDAKALRLEQLIDEADHRLTRMRHVAERLERQAGNHAPESSATPADPSAHASSRPALDRDAATPPASPPESNPAAEANESSEQEDPLRRSVYELADQGLEAQEIARRLDEHTGKVELILALRRA